MEIDEACFSNLHFILSECDAGGLAIPKSLGKKIPLPGTFLVLASVKRNLSKFCEQ